MKQLSFRLICFVLLITQLPISNLAQTNDSSTSKPEQDESRVLEKGVPIEREFRRGQVHSYKINLAAGQYLKVLVTQPEINVIINVIGPDEKKIVEVDTRVYGTEQISVLANVSGSYNLEIRTRTSCHPFDKSECDGRYEIKIAELRDSTPDDTVRFTAQQLYSQIGPSRPGGERIEKLKEIRKLWKSVGEVPLEANTLNNIAYDYQGIGEWTKVIEYYEEALRLWKSLGDGYAEGDTLFLLGNARRILGEFEKALDYYEQSLALYRSHGHKRGEIDMLRQIALIYVTAGDYKKALHYYNQQLTITAAENYSQGTVLENMGNLFRLMGQKQKGDEYTLKALADILNLPERVDDIRSLRARRELFIRLRDKQKIAEYTDKIVEFYRERKDRLNEALTLRYAGDIYYRLGEYQRALDYFSQATSIYRTIDSPTSLLGMLDSIGTAYAAVGNHRTALDYYNQAYSINQVHLRPDYKAIVTYGIARSHRDLGNLDEALLRAEEMISTIESQRTLISNSELRRAFSAKSHEYYKFYIDLLMLIHKRNPSSGYAAKALQASEKFRARSLLESLSEASVNIRQGVDLELLDREREVGRRLGAAAERQTRLLSAKHSEEQAAQVKREVDAVTVEFENVQAQIRRTSPRYSALTQPVPLSASEIQSDLLDKDTVLLEYSLGEDRSYLWVVTSNSLKTYELPKRADIEDDVRRVVGLLNNGERWVADEKINAEYAEAAGVLSRKVLPPSIMPQLKGKRLAIVSDGALQYLPFGALPLPQESKPKKQKTKNRYPSISRRI